MRYAVSASVGTLIWAAILGCFIKSCSIHAAPADESALTQQKPETEDAVPGSLELDSSASKRDWNRNLHSWGKRSWQNFQGGWGKRGASYPLYYPYADKRAWQKFQGAWGKRFASPDDELAIKQLAALIDQEERSNSPYDNNDYLADLAIAAAQQHHQQRQQQQDNSGDADVILDEEEKRAWKGLNGGWGKRGGDNWSNFRGSWGKRDPAWTNLKGIWGKRSIVDDGYPADLRISQ